MICAIYVFEIVGGFLRKDEESLELRFFSKEEMPEIFAEDHKLAIERYYNDFTYPVIEENKIKNK